jgi:hypothetical protein
VIGDFGIHKRPENPVLTKEGRKIGPALYCAQEMLDYKQDGDVPGADFRAIWLSLGWQGSDKSGEGWDRGSG